MSLAAFSPRQGGSAALAEEEEGRAGVGQPPARMPVSNRQRRTARVTRQALWPAADVSAVVIAASVTGTGPARGACYGALVLVGLAAGGSHRLPLCLRASDQLGRLTVAAALPALALATWLSAVGAVELAACTTGLLVTLRAVAAGALRAAYCRGLLARPTLIIGACPAGRQLARLIGEHPELGLTLRGVLDDRPDLPRHAGRLSPPLVGRTRDAGAVVAADGIAQVLVCSPAAAVSEVVAAVRECRSHGAQVAVLPRLPELGIAVPRTRLDEIWGMPLIPIRPDAQAIARRVTKRVTDLALGAIMVAVTAPLLLMLAAAVRCDLRLPVLFRQVRIVGSGRRASITKLRTLKPRGDPDTAWRVSAGQYSAFGQLLRATHADELPQLASVLKGDMSLVGPRPERPYFARRLAAAIPGYADRERVTAGLTGWAQVHGLSGNTSISDRARFDNFYIEYWSIWLDLLILARTGPAALSGALRSARGGSS